MKNVAVKVEGNTLTLTVDLTKEVGVVAKSGNTMVASSEGFQALQDGEHGNIKLNLNIIKK